MKPFRNIFAAVIMFTITVGASATHTNYISCIKERWNLISEEVTGPAKCEESKKLALVSDQFTYPHMGLGTMNVRYWQGEIVKVVETERIYEHSYVNVCSGVVTYTEEIKKVFVSYDAFTIVNPNLDYTITESFRLAPLTTKEATIAFEKLKQDCIN